MGVVLRGVVGQDDDGSLCDRGVGGGVVNLGESAMPDIEPLRKRFDMNSNTVKLSQ